jgi:PhoPQ-activated pathogenicity-related protein
VIQPDDLSKYVGKPDSAAQWEWHDESRGEHGTLYDLGLVSQVWQGITWKHRLQICVPTTGAYPDTALLWISSHVGDRADPELIQTYAEETGTVCACLYDIPNQPLFNDLYEDAIIAYTFVQYLDTDDVEWPLLFPMVKSVVRAMDVIQEMLPQAGYSAPQRFVVGGASKRGWTTWLTAATDSRVAGIFPMVYDNLNLFAQMPHQVKSFGEYSEQIGDYTEYDLPAKINSERGYHLTLAIDPYTYRALLTMPKLIINGANDRYWPTDALNLYWPDLTPPKSVLYVPNSGHSLEDFQRVYNTSTAFIRAVAAGGHLPSVEGTFTPTEETIALSLASQLPARSGRLWIARSPTRDFRNAPWESVPLRAEADHLIGEVETPSEGCMALFGEADFVQEDRPFTLSTQTYLATDRAE